MNIIPNENHYQGKSFPGEILPRGHPSQGKFLPVTPPPPSPVNIPPTARAERGQRPNTCRGVHCPGQRPTPAGSPPRPRSEAKHLQRSPPRPRSEAKHLQGSPPLPRSEAKHLQGLLHGPGQRPNTCRGVLHGPGQRPNTCRGVIHCPGQRPNTCRDSSTAKVRGQTPAGESSTAQVRGQTPAGESSTAQVRGQTPAGESSTAQGGRRNKRELSDRIHLNHSCGVHITTIHVTTPNIEHTSHLQPFDGVHMSISHGIHSISHWNHTQLLCNTVTVVTHV